MDLTRKQIINEVARELGFTPEELLSKSRLHKLNRARVIMWQVMREYGYSFHRIGAICNRDHSTISHVLYLAAPELIGMGKEMADKFKNVKVENKVEKYPEVYETITIKIPDYKKNKIVEIQKVVKKLVKK